MVVSGKIIVDTRGNGDTRDITELVQEQLHRSGLAAGVVTLCVVGSTAGLTTLEFEPGAVADLQMALERVAPREAVYKHHFRWGDDNGHSHVRAALLGPSLSIPFLEGRLTLGTWQQVILVDFDTRARRREVIVQIIGE
ncbi:MAG: secondary thiamine-phosphate synthase enzyme YjbQ [bacterium]